MLLTRAFSEPRAPLKKSQSIYFSLSASPGIVYIEMISKNQYAFGALGQSQGYMLKLKAYGFDTNGFLQIDIK